MQALGDRMKRYYEDKTRFYLTRRVPVIMRLDGRAFHTLTKSCDKPFDGTLQRIMVEVAKKLLTEIQGANCAYTQSDEISILITDFQELNTSAWFDYNIQKMSSIAAAIASVHFNSFQYLRPAVFDCRVFNVPPSDVTNYFVWRQKDWIRNSLHMYAASFFTHAELQGKKVKDLHEMLYTKGRNWATDLKPHQKNGTFIHREHAGLPAYFGTSADIFTDNRQLIERYLPTS